MSGVAPYFWSVALTMAAVAVPTSEDSLASAEAHFRAGRYREAAATYDAVQFEAPANGLFRLNQGNAHFLAGNPPHAILAYRRAERLLGNDSRLRANLAEVRKQVSYPTPETAPADSSWLGSISRPGQATLALAGYLVGWMLLGLWLVRRRRGIVVLCLVFLTGSGILAAAVAGAERTDRDRPIAVVSHTDTILRKGNGTSYPAVEVNGVGIKLGRGVEARVRATRSNRWVQLEFADGLIGWVASDQVLIDHQAPADGPGAGLP